MLHFIGVYFTLIFVWMACLAAGTVAGKPVLAHYRSLAWLILLLGLVETAANILAFNNIKNHFLFNLSESVRFLGVARFFYVVLANSALKKIALGFLFLFPVFVLANMVLVQGFFTLNTASYVLGGSFVLLLSVAYIWQLYVSDETRSIFRDPAFWISLAYLLFLAVSVPYIGMLNYLWNKYPSFTSHYYDYIFQTALIIHNILLTAGFLCMRPSLKQN